MLKDYFIKQGIKEIQIEEFIRKNFPLGDYSRTELQRTPLGIKIVIYTNKPGRIIGRGGKNINDMTEAIKKHFNLENPQLDVKKIDNPNLDASIVAKQIASALEKGFNYKKIGNLTMKRIIESGAVGAQIVIAGKLGGGKGVTAKFVEGHLKHSGQPRKELVDEGYEEIVTKPGKIGIKVMIMKEYRDITGMRKDIKKLGKVSEDATKLITEELAEAPKDAEEEILEAGEKPKAAKAPKRKVQTSRKAEGKEPAKSKAKPKAASEKKEAQEPAASKRADKSAAGADGVTGTGDKKTAGSDNKGGIGTVKN